MLAATKHKTVFLTQRGLRHQQRALEAAPPELNITIRHDPARDELLALLAEAEFLISKRSGEIGRRADCRRTQPALDPAPGNPDLGHRFDGCSVQRAWLSAAGRSKVV